MSARPYRLEALAVLLDARRLLAAAPLRAARVRAAGAGELRRLSLLPATTSTAVAARLALAPRLRHRPLSTVQRKPRCVQMHLGINRLVQLIAFSREVLEHVGDTADQFIAPVRLVIAEAEM